MSRNKKITIGIFAHVDAGKTTLSEAILYLTGEIRKPGRVDRGDTFLDDNIIERNRGITIFSRQARFSMGKKDDTGSASKEPTVFTIIDTPGHIDFAAEMERSMSVIDYALLVISGSEGIQPHTKTLHRMLSARGIPVFIFINKMDIAVSSAESIINNLNEDLGFNAVDFRGASERTDDFTDAVTLYSSELAEAVLEGDDLSDSMIADAVTKCDISPCMFGSALKFDGVNELLEVLHRYTVMPQYGDEFGARVYKVSDSEDGERLCFIKVCGGTLSVKDKVKWQSRDDSHGEDKVNQIRLYSGSRFITADTVTAGDVCAVTGLGRLYPGDGLGSMKPLAGFDIRPFMVYSVTGPDGVDPYNIMKDLQVLTAEDPALKASWDQDGGIEIRLMGQVQLEVLKALIKERFGYDVSFGTGNVLYLETIDGVYEGVGHFEPLRHYAEVHLIIEPGSRGSGIAINSSVPEDKLALNWQRLIATHLEEKDHIGTLTGSPLTDVRITIAAGRAHEKHTEGGDFREATYRAVRQALMQARADGRMRLLEPWCEYEMELPSRLVGRAMTDIRQMGGTQDGLEQNGDTARIYGKVPAVEFGSYQQIFTGYTSGEGRMSSAPCGYDICHNTDEVVTEAGYDPERDTYNPADSVFVNHSGSDIVKWDKVTEFMHLGSVLRKEASESSTGYAGSNFALAGRSDAVDVKEEARRKLAAEKELRMIFERTYGGPKQTRRSDKRESVYRSGVRISGTDDTKDNSRNEEIKAKHERKTAKPDTKPALIIIDGYNLIFANEYLKELADRDAGSARDQIIERLSNYAGYTGLEVAVVFDAYKVPYGTGHEENVNGIRVIFTPENEPADIYMGIMTNTIKDRQIYVVSSDMLVQQDAWGHGAFRISSREFIKTLESTEQEIREHLALLND